MLWSHSLFADDFGGDFRVAAASAQVATLKQRSASRGVISWVLGGDKLKWAYAAAREAYASCVFEFCESLPLLAAPACAEPACKTARTAALPVLGGCPQCGDRPDVLVCDGTALGQHRSRFGVAPPAAGGPQAPAGFTYPQYALLAAGAGHGMGS